MSGQVELFGTGDVARPAGPTELATRRSLAAAGLDPTCEGAGAALVDLAWALDAARAAGKFYGVAQAAPPYLELARSLGLTVDSQKGTDDGDGLDSWLRQLTQPTLGDTPQP